MTHYEIIRDEDKLDDFIKLLPENNKDEVYYICLFGRHKYCKEFPNTRDSGQLARVIAGKEGIKEKIRRLESPVGSYTRDGIAAPQQALAMYISMNPRSLPKANKELLCELARRVCEGDTTFNPITLATTCVHKANDRKFFLDFDFDLDYDFDSDGDLHTQEYLKKIKEILPENSFLLMRTRGGFHLIVILDKIKDLKTKWYLEITALPNCDVRGTNTLTPIPGCVQGEFTPYLL